MSLRTRRSLALLTVTVLVAAACGPATPATNVPSGTTPATATPAGTPGGTPTGTAGTPTTTPEVTPTATTTGSGDFSFAVDGEPTTFAGPPNDLPTSWVAGLIYNSLYQANNKLEMVPYLASALPTTSEDGLTWTVPLRTDVKFHDGTPMTAADVVWNYHITGSPNCVFNSDVCGAIADNVESVTADGDNVVFVLKQKFAPFLTTGLGSVTIMPEAAIEASFQRLQTASGTVTDAAIHDLLTEVTTKTDQDADNPRVECEVDLTVTPAPSPPPEDCAMGFWKDQLAAILTSAGIELPNEAGYQAAPPPDGPGGLDADAYATALLGQLSDLDTVRTSSSIDQIAAAMRIIDFARKPIGTGPYSFVKYQAAQSIELARFDGYFHNTVGPARVLIPIIKEAAAASAALQRGDILWQTEITSDALPTLQADPNLQIAEYPDFGYYFIAFNLRKGHPYADKTAREAFSMCIDHDADIAAATENNGVPVYANTPPASWAFNPDVPHYTYDVAAATALLDSNGYTKNADGIYGKGGQTLSTDLYVRKGRPQRVAFAQLARDQLALCGIAINVIEADFATVLLPLLSYPNNYDTYLGGWGTSIDPDDFSIFHSSHATTKDNPDDNNFVGWINKDADKFLEDGRTTLDQDARKAIYAQFQVLLHNDLPYYLLWSDVGHAGLSKRVTGDIDLASPLYYWNNDTWSVAAPQ
jgi:ABC-type transport system substrate-binding protein